MASCRCRIASATFGSRAFSCNRAVACAICWLVMPPCASCAAVNISASSAWLWSFCRAASPHRRPGRAHQHRAGAGLQRGQRLHRLAADRQRGIGLAPLAPTGAHAAVGVGQRLRFRAARGRKPRWTAADRPAPDRSRPRRGRHAAGAIQPSVDDRPRQPVALGEIGRRWQHRLASSGRPMMRSTTPRLRRASISPSSADCAPGSVSRSSVGSRSATNWPLRDEGIVDPAARGRASSAVGGD